MIYMENEEEFGVRRLNEMGDRSEKLTLAQIVEAVKKGYFLFLDKRYVPLKEITADKLNTADSIKLKLRNTKEILVTPSVRGG